MNNLNLLPTGIVRIFILAFVSLPLSNGCSDQSGNQAKATLPTDKEIVALTSKTTLDFARAVNAGDLALFMDSTAEEYKQKFTVQQFNQAFRGFIDQKINLLAIQRHTPIFEPPPHIADGKTLTVQGYFPTSPSQVQFNYTYQQDPVEWKITGIDIKVVPKS